MPRLQTTKLKYSQAYKGMSYYKEKRQKEGKSGEKKLRRTDICSYFLEEYYLLQILMRILY